MADEALTPEQDQSRPDYYKRMVCETQRPDGTWTYAVAASRLREELGEGLFLALEVDENNLPVTEPRVQPILVADLRGDRPSIKPARPPVDEPDKPHEHHFRLGGARSSTGVYDATRDVYVPFSHTKDPLWDRLGMGARGVTDAAILDLNERPTLKDVVAVATALADRDWSDINSRLSPKTLATSVAEGGAGAFIDTVLISFDPPEGQSVEDSALYKEVAEVIQDEEVWRRIRNVNLQTREALLKGISMAYNHRMHGEHMPLRVPLRHYVYSVVNALVYPAAEQALTDHAEEIAAIERDYPAAQDFEEADSARTWAEQNDIREIS
ncbi:MAG TPA: hypothetical protein VGS28_00225 [Candidatus Saccharimonadales bacterium]|nr:hypothetical protein [Candidatus Saccharimonadales bacterium]